MGRIGRFVIGGILIGASFLIPGSGAFISGLSSILLAGGVSLVQAAIFTPSGIHQRQDAILSNYPSTMAPLPVVYGQTLLGIRPVDIRVDESSDNNRNLWIVGALCHGSGDGSGIESIDEIYFDGKLAVDFAGVVQSPWASHISYWKYLGTYTQNVATGGSPTLNSVFPTAWPTTSQGRGVACIVMRLTYDKEVFASG